MLHNDNELELRFQKIVISFQKAMARFFAFIYTYIFHIIIKIKLSREKKVDFMMIPKNILEKS